MDETWAHHFDLETKQQSMLWKHPTSPPVVKFRKTILASKVTVSVFWDSEGVLVVDYLEQGKTVTGVMSITLSWSANCVKQSRKSAEES